MGLDRRVGGPISGLRGEVPRRVRTVGHLALEVYGEVPLTLLDPLETVNADRIATLIECPAEYTDHPMVVLLRGTHPH